MNKYWCVINWRHREFLKAADLPTKAHSTYLAAVEEAERLAKANPSDYFTVFEAVARVSTLIPVEPRVGWEDLK